jgi:transglutaminase-like putative cysteine protease
MVTDNMNILEVGTPCCGGYLLDLYPIGLHACFEAYVGDRWYTFDPTQSDMNGGYISIRYGRDAADVAIYTQFGPSVYLLTQTVNAERIWSEDGLSHP